MARNQSLISLEAAWDRWDKHPADPRAADAMVYACKAVAEELDMPYVKFRARMQELRRKGNTKAQVIDKVTVLLGPTKP